MIIKHYQNVNPGWFHDELVAAGIGVTYLGHDAEEGERVAQNVEVWFEDGTDMAEADRIFAEVQAHGDAERPEPPPVDPPVTPPGGSLPEGNYTWADKSEFLEGLMDGLGVNPNE